MEIFQFGDLRVSLITLLLDFESTDSRQKGLNRTSMSILLMLWMG